MFELAVQDTLFLMPEGNLVMRYADIPRWAEEARELSWFKPWEKVLNCFGVTVLPASANSTRYRSKLLRVIPFARPAPSRRIALAWRKSFARTQAIDALAQAVALSKVTGIQHLE